MKVVIDRAKWNTGNRLFGEGQLLTRAKIGDYDEYLDEWLEVGNPECRCCLGFLAEACGVPDDVAAGTAYPSEVSNADTVGPISWPKALFEPSSAFRESQGKLEAVPWEIVFADFNDTEKIDHTSRESWIAEGFRIVLGVELEYVGEYVERDPEIYGEE